MSITWYVSMRTEAASRVSQEYPDARPRLLHETFRVTRLLLSDTGLCGVAGRQGSTHWIYEYVLIVIL